MSNSESLFILPAPPDTRCESDTIYYEVELAQEDKKVRVTAFNTRREEVGVAEVQKIGEYETKTTLSEKTVRVSVQFTRAQLASGDIQLKGRINDHALEITGRASAPESVKRTGTALLNPDESAMVARWGRLGDSLVTLSEAVRIRTVTREWNCTACLVVLAGDGVLVGACFGGALPACGASFIASGTILANCEGACA